MTVDGGGQGVIIRGRRIPVVEGIAGEPSRMGELSEPGDYCGPVHGYTGDKPAVFFLKPNARDKDAPAIARSIQHVTSPPHTFRECPDGSLEIRNSLGDQHQLGDGSVMSDGWHGYLDEGHLWRKV